GKNICTFVNQIFTTNMTKSGDSGSLLLDCCNKAIGLLSYGSPLYDVSSPIQFILDYFKVHF
ncbi:MAG: hypothetical protein ACRC7R_09660, partial [Sarcina sp.]